MYSGYGYTVLWSITNYRRLICFVSYMISYFILALIAPLYASTRENWYDRIFLDNFNVVIAVQRGTDPQYSENPADLYDAFPEMGMDSLIFKSNERNDYIAFRADGELHALDPSIKPLISSGGNYFKAFYNSSNIMFCESNEVCGDALYSSYGYQVQPKTYAYEIDSCETKHVIKLTPVAKLSVYSECSNTGYVGEDDFDFFSYNSRNYAMFQFGSTSDQTFSILYVIDDVKIKNSLELGGEYIDLMVSNTTYGSDMEFKVACGVENFKIQFCKNNVCFYGYSLYYSTMGCFSHTYTLDFIFDSDSELRLYELHTTPSNCHPDYVAGNGTSTFSKCVSGYNNTFNFEQSGVVSMYKTLYHSTSVFYNLNAQGSSECVMVTSKTLGNVQFIDSSNAIGFKRTNDGCANLTPDLDLKFNTTTLVKSSSYATNYTTDIYVYSDDNCQELSYIYRKIVNNCSSSINARCSNKRVVFCQAHFPFADYNSNSRFSADIFQMFSGLNYPVFVFSTSNSTDLLEYIYLNLESTTDIAIGNLINQNTADIDCNVQKCTYISPKDYLDFGLYYPVFHNLISSNTNMKVEFAIAAGAYYYYGYYYVSYGDTQHFNLCKSVINGRNRQNGPFNSCISPVTISIVPESAKQIMFPYLINGELHVQFIETPGTSIRTLVYSISSFSFKEDYTLSKLQPEISVFSIMAYSYTYFTYWTDTSGYSHIKLSTRQLEFEPQRRVFIEPKMEHAYWLWEESSFVLYKYNIDSEENEVESLMYQFQPSDQNYIRQLIDQGGVYFDNLIYVNYNNYSPDTIVIQLTPFPSVRIIDGARFSLLSSNFAILNNKLYICGISGNELYLSETVAGGNTNTIYQKYTGNTQEQISIVLKAESNNLYAHVLTSAGFNILQLVRESNAEAIAQFESKTFSPLINVNHDLYYLQYSSKNLHLLNSELTPLHEFEPFDAFKNLGCFNSDCYSLLIYNNSSKIVRISTDKKEQNVVYHSEYLYSSNYSQIQTLGSKSEFVNFTPTQTDLGTVFQYSSLSIDTFDIHESTETSNEFVKLFKRGFQESKSEQVNSQSIASYNMQSTYLPDDVVYEHKFVNSSIFAFHPSALFIKNGSHINCIGTSIPCDSIESSFNDVLIESSVSYVYIYQVFFNSTFTVYLTEYNMQTMVKTTVNIINTDENVVLLASDITLLKKHSIDLVFVASPSNYNDSTSLYHIHHDEYNSSIDAVELVSFSSQTRVQLFRFEETVVMVCGYINQAIVLLEIDLGFHRIRESHTFGRFPNLQDFYIHMEADISVIYLQVHSLNITTVYAMYMGDSSPNSVIDLSNQLFSEIQTIYDISIVTPKLETILCDLNAYPPYSPYLKLFYKYLDIPYISKLECIDNKIVQADNRAGYFKFSYLQIELVPFKTQQYIDKIAYRATIDSRFHHSSVTIQSIPVFNPMSINLFEINKQIVIAGRGFGNKDIQEVEPSCRLTAFWGNVALEYTITTDLNITLKHDSISFYIPESVSVYGLLRSVKIELLIDNRLFSASTFIVHRPHLSLSDIMYNQASTNVILQSSDLFLLKNSSVLCFSYLSCFNSTLSVKIRVLSLLDDSSISHDYSLIQSIVEPDLQGVAIVVNTVDPLFYISSILFTSLTSPLSHFVQDLEMLNTTIVPGSEPIIHSIAGDFDFKSTTNTMIIRGTGFRVTHSIASINCNYCKYHIKSWNDSTIEFTIWETNIFASINRLPSLQYIPVSIAYAQFTSNVVKIQLVNTPVIGSFTFEYDPFVLFINGFNLICNFELSYKYSHSLNTGIMRDYSHCDSNTTIINMPLVGDNIMFNELSFKVNNYTVIEYGVNIGGYPYSHSSVLDVLFNGISSLSIAESHQSFSLNLSKYYKDFPLVNFKINPTSSSSMSSTFVNLTRDGSLFSGYFTPNTIKVLISNSDINSVLYPLIIESAPNNNISIISNTFNISYKYPSVSDPQLIYVSNVRYVTFDLLNTDDAPVAPSTYPCISANNSASWYTDLIVSYTAPVTRTANVYKCNNTNIFILDENATGMLYVSALEFGYLDETHVINHKQITLVDISVLLPTNVTSIDYYNGFVIGDYVTIIIQGFGLATEDLRIETPLYNTTISDATINLEYYVFMNNTVIILRYMNIYNQKNYFMNLTFNDEFKVLVESPNLSYTTYLITRRPVIESVKYESGYLVVRGTNLPRGPTSQAICVINNVFGYREDLGMIDTIDFIYKTPKNFDVVATYTSCTSDYGLVLSPTGYGTGLTANGLNINFSLKVLPINNTNIPFIIAPTLSGGVSPPNKFILDNNWTIMLYSTSAVFGNIALVSQYNPLNITISYNSESYTVDASDSLVESWTANKILVNTDLEKFSSLDLNTAGNLSNGFNLLFTVNVGGVIYHRNLTVQYPIFTTPASWNTIESASESSSLSSSPSSSISTLIYIALYNSYYSVSFGNLSIKISDLNSSDLISNAAHVNNQVLPHKLESELSNFIPSDLYLELKEYSNTYTGGINANSSFTRVLNPPFVFFNYTFNLDSITMDAPFDSLSISMFDSPSLRLDGNFGEVLNNYKESFNIIFSAFDMSSITSIQSLATIDFYRVASSEVGVISIWNSTTIVANSVMLNYDDLNINISNQATSTIYIAVNIFNQISTVLSQPFVVNYPSLMDRHESSNVNNSILAVYGTYLAEVNSNDASCTLHPTTATVYHGNSSLYNVTGGVCSSTQMEFSLMGIHDTGSSYTLKNIRMNVYGLTKMFPNEISFIVAKPVVFESFNQFDLYSNEKIVHIVGINMGNITLGVPMYAYFVNAITSEVNTTSLMSPSSIVKWTPNLIVLSINNSLIDVNSRNYSIAIDFNSTLAVVPVYINKPDDIEWTVPGNLIGDKYYVNTNSTIKVPFAMERASNLTSNGTSSTIFNSSVNAAVRYNNTYFSINITGHLGNNSILFDLEGISCQSITIYSLSVSSVFGTVAYNISNTNHTIHTLYYYAPIINSVDIDTLRLLYEVPMVTLYGDYLGINSIYSSIYDNISITYNFSSNDPLYDNGNVSSIKYINRYHDKISFEMPAAHANTSLYLNSTLMLHLNISIFGELLQYPVSINMPLIGNTLNNTLLVLDNKIILPGIVPVNICTVTYTISGFNLINPIAIAGCIYSIQVPDYYSSGYSIDKMAVELDNMGFKYIEIPLNYYFDYPKVQLTDIYPSYQLLYDPLAELSVKGINIPGYVYDYNFINTARLIISHHNVTIFNSTMNDTYSIKNSNDSIIVLPITKELKPFNFYDSVNLYHNYSAVINVCISTVLTSCLKFEYRMPGNITSEYRTYNNTHYIMDVQYNDYIDRSSELGSSSVYVSSLSNSLCMNVSTTILGEYIKPIYASAMTCSNSFTIYTPLFIGDAKIARIKLLFSSDTAAQIGINELNIKTLDNNLVISQLQPIIYNTTISHGSKTDLINNYVYPCINGQYKVVINGINLLGNYNALDESKIGLSVTGNGISSMATFTDSIYWDNSMIVFLLPINRDACSVLGAMQHDLTVGNFNISIGQINVVDWLLVDSYTTDKIPIQDKSKNLIYYAMDIKNIIYVLEIANLGYSTSASYDCSGFHNDQIFKITLSVDDVEDLNHLISAYSCIDAKQFIYFNLPRLYGRIVRIKRVQQYQGIYRHDLNITNDATLFYSFNTPVYTDTLLIASNQVVKLSRFNNNIKSPVFIPGNAIQITGKGFGDQLAPALDRRQIVFNCAANRYNYTLDCQDESNGCIWRDTYINITMPKMLISKDQYCEFATIVQLGNLNTIAGNIKFGNRLPFLNKNDTIAQGTTYSEIIISSMITDLDMDSFTMNITLLNQLNDVIDTDMLKDFEWYSNKVNSDRYDIFDLKTTSGVARLNTVLQNVRATRTLSNDINGRIYMKIPSLLQGTFYYLVQVSDGFNTKAFQYQMDITPKNNVPVISNCLPIGLNSNYSMDCIGFCQYRRFNVFKSIVLSDPNRIYANQPYSLKIKLNQTPKIGNLYHGNTLLGNDVYSLQNDTFDDFYYFTNSTLDNSTNLLGNISFSIIYNNVNASCHLPLSLACDSGLYPNVYKRKYAISSTESIYRLCEFCPDGAICDDLGLSMPEALSGWKFDPSTGTFSVFID
eukprot:NODE_40_length_29852_cov_0.370215.p1 type:complete len:4094 gc:universal NODE_40_length_29852_cov_0.370215:7026-19307(+)